MLILARLLHIQSGAAAAANHHSQRAETEAERQTAKDTSGCGFTHEVQEKQQPTFGSCRRLVGFEIGHVIAPPEAREISGGLDPDWPLQSPGSRRHNTIQASVTEISIQTSMSSAQRRRRRAHTSADDSAFSVRPC